MQLHPTFCFFRRKFVLRPLSMVLLIAFAAEFILPVTAYAIGGGPTQPEATGFRQADASELVDPYSGDFSYNIPLLDVDGYPVNLAYTSGISMEQEATWVGLGWTLNVGALNRTMRGLPDDFNGDEIKKETNIKNNHTFGMIVDPGSELIGLDAEYLADKQISKKTLKPFKPGEIPLDYGINWNNYNGMGMEFFYNPAINAATPNFGLTGFGIKASSTSGTQFDPRFNASFSISKKLEDQSVRKIDFGFFGGLPYNSVSGFSRMSFGISVQKEISKQSIDNTPDEPSLVRNYSEGSTLNFGYPFSIPNSRLRFLNTNLSLTGTVGLASFGIHGNVRLKGYYSGQFLLKKDREIKTRSYGYLHTQVAQNDEDAMLDFNREKEGSYSENTPRLPLTNYTYDILTASGQGMAGTYRPYRNDVGVMRDNTSRMYSAGMDVPGMEFGAGGTFHMGFNLALNATDGYSGIWKDDNPAYEPLKAANMTTGVNESYYYKKVGEKTPGRDETFIANIDDDRPVRINLTDGKQNARAEFEKEDGNSISFPANLERYKDTRAKRNEPLSGITAAESYAALNTQIRSYNFISPGQTINSSVFKAESGPQPYTDIQRSEKPKHHFTEYTAVNTNGARYVYGIPAYNHMQQDVTFAISSGSGCSYANECTYPDIVSYCDGDDSKDNTKGIDNFFERITTPAYAHSYLLTAVLSDDYADITHNGPSDDDKGTYTKFNYSRIENFKWRTPYTQTTRQAFFNAGIGVNKLDDKASYVYGEKELWYLHSIETKNYIAVFITDDRMDGVSALGKDGGLGTVRSKMLRRIELYVKSELLNPDPAKKPVPVKTVHFSYDYSLCPNVKDNSGEGVNKDGEDVDISDLTNVNEQRGKLTLTGVYFTYGNSTRAANRGYTFTYGFNPGYSYKAYDRWGSYKPAPGLISNADYPYAEPDKTMADEYAQAWNLELITLPSGGTIKVDYEADDYGFVQNKKPMRMFTVIGSSINKQDNPFTGTSSSVSCGDASRKEGTLYEASDGANLGINLQSYQYYYLKVNDPVADQAELKRKYFSDENGNFMKLYFKFFVKTKDAAESGGPNPDNYEVIPGYINENNYDFGVCNYDNSSGKTRYIWIRLKPTNIGDYVQTGNANPISRAAWDFLRLRYPRLGQARADYTPGELNPLAMFQELGSALLQFAQVFTGYFYTLRKRNISRKFDCDKSVFRLYSPDHTKIGGGSRVKRITLNDKFNALTGNSVYTDQEYGKEYFYKTTLEGREISSGVATYEPMLGGEESPFRQPLIKGTDQKFMAIGNEYLQESTFGESFFPMASVGYSKVTIRSIQKHNSRSTATGKEEREFYTSRDFPNFVYETKAEAYRTKPELLFTFLRFYSFDHMAASQGYSVELNDMPGKPKSVKSFAQGHDDEPINSTEYFYKRDLQNQNKLDNHVTTIDNEGKIKSNVVAGVETDIVVDMQEERSRTHGGTVSPNIDAFIAFVPIVLPFIIPNYVQENIKFRSAVVTKVVNRSGLLDSVVVKDNGARKITRNLAVDDESGEVLVTRINNNFNDPVYQVNLPAYWMYDEMAPAYKRLGAEFRFTNVMSNPSAYLQPGDEVLFGDYYGWVISTSPELAVLSNSGIYYNIPEIVEDEEVKYIKVVRPGNHNKMMLPASSTIVKTNPLSGEQLSFRDVVDANARFYDDNWKVFCGCNNVIGLGFNPYIAGRRGNFKLVKDYVFLTNRTQSKYNNNINVRKDGTYTAFTPFWNYDKQWKPDSSSWTFSSENMIMSSTGALLETRDALNRYSAAQFSFADRANVAIGQNAMYREIGYDSFEDYEFLLNEACKESHFSFFGSYSLGTDNDLVGTRAAVELSSDSHSGKHSLKLSNQNNYIKIRKNISPCR